MADAATTAKGLGSTALTWLPKIFLFAAVTGTLLGVPASSLLAASPDAGLVETGKVALSTVFNNTSHIPETIQAFANTVEYGASSLATALG